MRASLHCASLPWASWRTERTWKVILVWVSVITVSAHRQVLAGRAMAWQAEGNQRREQHERAGDPQARLRSEERRVGKECRSRWEGDEAERKRVKTGYRV